MPSTIVVWVPKKFRENQIARSRILLIEQFNDWSSCLEFETPYDDGDRIDPRSVPCAFWQARVKQKKSLYLIDIAR